MSKQKVFLIPTNGIGGTHLVELNKLLETGKWMVNNASIHQNGQAGGMWFVVAEEVPPIATGRAT